MLIETATRRPPHPWRKTAWHIEIDILRLELWIETWFPTARKCLEIWLWRIICTNSGAQIDKKGAKSIKMAPKATKLRPKIQIWRQTMPKVSPNQSQTSSKRKKWAKVPPKGLQKSSKNGAKSSQKQNRNLEWFWNDIWIENLRFKMDFASPDLQNTL